MHKIIVANYKMNGDKAFYTNIQKRLNKLNVKDTNLVLCPPFVYLPFFKISNNNIVLGSQDIANVQKNKATGQVGPEMLVDFNVRYSIIGHSERRAIGETENLIAEKVKIAKDNGIMPIICVGEESKTIKTSVIRSQVESALSRVQGCDIVFAYEPIWAIGSGVVPTIDNINKASMIIKEVCSEKGFVPKILYGGSVDANNYKELIKANIDGFLVGGTSLKIDEFEKLVKGVDNE